MPPKAEKGKKEAAEPKKAPSFKAGDLVWVKMRGYPVWPGLVFKEKDAPSKVLKAKRGAKATLLRFLESNQFYWANASELVKFRSKLYGTYSDKKKKPKAWIEAFDLCTKYETGDFKPLPVAEDEEESDSDAKATTGKRKRSNSTSSTKTPPAKRRKVSKSPSAKATTPRGGKAAAPKKEKAAAATPKTPRGGRKKKTRVPFSKEVFDAISVKLTDFHNEDTDENDEEVVALLEILDRMELKDVNILRSTNTLVTPLKALKDSTNEKIKTLASSIFAYYAGLVSSVGVKSSGKNEPEASTSKKKKSTTAKTNGDKSGDDKEEEDSDNGKTGDSDDKADVDTTDKAADDDKADDDKAEVDDNTEVDGDKEDDTVAEEDKMKDGSEANEESSSQ